MALNRFGWFCSTLFLALFLPGLSGCLISGDTQETRTGTYVSENTFAQIEAGKTTMGWVQATLGEPTTKAKADDDVVWTYRYTEHKDSTGAVFLIFGAHNSTEVTHSAYIDFRDGIVFRKWRG